MTQLLKEVEAAKLLGVSVSALRKWRRLGMGPTVHRIEDRLVRYSVEDLDSYLEACRTPTGGANEN